jgi:hypothetical protein
MARYSPPDIFAAHKLRIVANATPDRGCVWYKIIVDGIEIATVFGEDGVWPSVELPDVPELGLVVREA